MLFRFLTYLQPTHYFALKNKAGKFVFPIAEKIPKNVFSQLELDDSFKSKVAKQYDLSWQAIQKGFIDEVDTYTDFENLPVIDEYIFIRKYFNQVWSLYVLLLRLFSFKNPLVEISAWFKTRKVKRSNFLKKPIQYLNWQNFESTLLKQKPLVTVVIPTLNRYPYLKDVLADLEKQDYINFEVIIVDQSQPFKKEFYSNFKLNIKLIQQKEKALWLARNTAINQSKGDLLLLFDDDSRVEKDWISNHIKCLDFFNAAISSGVSISKIGDQVPENYSFFRISDQLDTGNVLIKKEVFKKIGLFDRQFEKQRMGDGEFGLRAYLEGFLNISNPFAQRLHLKVGTGGLRQMGSWDAFRTQHWFSPRPIPSVLYFYRSYFGSKSAKLALSKTIPASIMPYKFKKNKFLKTIGVLFSILIFPLILFQVIKSWNLSSKKIRQGALIKKIH
ncbi:MAG: glycosyltransferase family 2 protein [Flavobacteriales bacterium]